MGGGGRWERVCVCGGGGGVGRYERGGRLGTLVGCM